MNTWTDSGLSEAGLIGAKLAIGVEARLPDGPARMGRGGPVPQVDVAPQRGGRRRAPEPGVPAADFADSFPLTGAAQLYTPAPVPLPSVPLPSEPLPPQPLLSEPLLSEPLLSEPLLSEPLLSQPPQSESDASSSIPSLPSVPSVTDDERDALRSSTDGFLAGGFSSSSTDSPWESGSVSSGMPVGLSGSWSQPVPITPQSPLDEAAASAPTTKVSESSLSPAVSAPTSLLPMPETTGSHRAKSSDSDDDQPADIDPAPRETFNVESETLGSLDSSDLFAALSRHRR